MGNPISAESFTASSSVRTNPPRGHSNPASSIACLNNSRSSAFLIAGSFAPISSALYLFNTPRSANSTATFNAVCPPMVGRIASGRSFSIIFSTKSAVIGSMYVASANSGSVIIVAGLLFTRIIRYPSSRSTRHACVPE